MRRTRHAGRTTSWKQGTIRAKTRLLRVFRRHSLRQASDISGSRPAASCPAIRGRCIGTPRVSAAEEPLFRAMMGNRRRLGRISIGSSWCTPFSLKVRLAIASESSGRLLRSSLPVYVSPKFVWVERVIFCAATGNNHKHKSFCNGWGSKFKLFCHHSWELLR